MLMTLFMAAALSARAVASAEGVKVSERFGYDPADSTRYLQAALDSGLPKIVLDRKEGPWVTTGLKGRSNQTVVFEDGVELVAKRGEFRGRYDILLSYANATNVELVGYGATMRMCKDDYTNSSKYAWSEWRHALSLSSCRDFSVRGLSIVSSGGDGIYIGETWTNGPNRNVTVRDVRCLANNRQGISVITADGLLIENCVLSDTCGTPPAAGIDFEPNARNQFLSRIVMRNCTLENNRGGGFDFAKWLLDNSSRPLDILIENCRSANNGYDEATGRIIIDAAQSPFRDVRGRVTFRNCELLDRWQTPDLLRNRRKRPTSFVLAVENCKVRDPSAAGGMTPMNEAWPDLPYVDRAGEGLTQVPAGLPEEFTVVDRLPGKSVPVKAPCFRYGAVFQLYAGKPGPVRLKVVHRQVGKGTLSPAKAKMQAGTDVGGKPLAVFETAGTEPAEWTFEAPRKGFYTLNVDPLPGAFGVLETDTPIALVGGGLHGGYNPDCVLTEGELFIEVAPSVSRFVAVVAGGGGNEKVRMSVFDPAGGLSFESADVGDFASWTSAEKPLPGLWRLRFRRPEKGHLEDFSIDLRGIPRRFFLSSEKRWVEKGLYCQ